MGQGVGLPGARSCDDQQRACLGAFFCSDAIFDCAALSLVQFLQMGRRRHSRTSISSLMSGRGLKNGGGTYKPERPLESGAFACAFAALCSRVLANSCQTLWSCRMGTINISLPDQLKSLADEQVAGRDCGTSSEYIRELIHRDQERLVLRRRRSLVGTDRPCPRGLLHQSARPDPWSAGQVKKVSPGTSPQYRL